MNTTNKPIQSPLMSVAKDSPVTILEKRRATVGLPLNEQRQAIRSLGGIMCDCPMPTPMGPAGWCSFCGVKGPQFETQLRLAELNGKRPHDAGTTDATTEQIEEEDDAGNPLLDSNGYVDWSKAFEAAPVTVPWIVEPFIEEGMTHALWGIPGDGKSVFVLETVVHKVLKKHPVLYVDSENHLLQIIVPRLKSFGMTPEDLGNLRFRSFKEMEPLDTPAGGKELLSYALESNAALVVIDTTSRFIGGEENSADTFLRFYNHTMMLLKRNNIASLRLDHPGKDTTKGTRGSSAKYGDIDYEFQITDEGTTRKLTCTKSRTGNVEKGKEILLRKHGITDDNPHFFHEWDYKPAQDPDVALLESLGIPADAGRRKVQEMLKAAGKKMSSERIDAAQALRQKIFEADDSGTGSLFVPEDVPEHDLG